MTDLRKSLAQAIAFLRLLRDDLDSGRAKEVPQTFGHVYEHLGDSEVAPSVFTADGVEIPMIRQDKCVDFLKLWGVWMYIATCPKTGIRYVEGVKP